MRATLQNGITIEGTPQEIAEVIKLVGKQDHTPVIIQYIPYTMTTTKSWRHGQHYIADSTVNTAGGSCTSDYHSENYTYTHATVTPIERMSPIG